MGFAGLGIDIDLDVVLGAVMRLGGALHRLFHRGQHDRLVDRLVAGDRVRDLQKFEPVGGNGAGHKSSLLKLGAFARLQIFLNELVGKNQLRFQHGAKRELYALALRRDDDIIAVQAFQPAAKALAAVERRVSSILASWPFQRVKSVSRVSGRSMPGEETSIS